MWSGKVSSDPRTSSLSLDPLPETERRKRFKVPLLHECYRVEFGSRRFVTYPVRTCTLGTDDTVLDHPRTRSCGVSDSTPRGTELRVHNSVTETDPCPRKPGSLGWYPRS